MTERDWKLLLALFEEKSITGATGVLHLTQPALSMRLRAIEEFFDARIVVRTRKGVQFTAEGEVLVRKARIILREYSDTRNILASMKSTVSGTLRIGASNFFTKYVLPGLLRKFKVLHPAIEYRVLTGWSKDMIQYIYNHDVHVAFVRGNYRWAGVRRLLFTECMCVACCRNFTMKTLPSLPLIQYRSDPTNQQLIDNWWTSHFSEPPQVGMVVDRVDTCLEMVKQGLGYGFLPSTILRGVEGLRIMKMRYASGELLERNTWMILKEETAGIRMVQEFLAMVDGMDFSDPPRV